MLDAFLAADPHSRVGCETLVTTNRVVLAGEVRGPASVTPDLLTELARDAIRDIGYDQTGFSWKHAQIDCLLHAQSTDIAAGVDSAGNKDEGAGDQGIMFGYACTETPALMPAPLHYAHQILLRIKRRPAVPATRPSPGCCPMPRARSRSNTSTASRSAPPASCSPPSTRRAWSSRDIKQRLTGLIKDVLPEGWMCPDAELYVNPTGNFVIGGPDGDAGLTGRKIIVDTYGGASPHGGGAFSGKDPTKVDRSAAYACRYLAKNVVAAGLAEKCTLQISYAIGVSHPLSVYVDLDGTGRDVEEAKLERVLRELMNLSPRGIREHLRMNRPIYAVTSAYGHFGREPDEAQDTFTWERTDLVPALRSAFDR